MNDASRWRIAVARRVEACYRQDSRVRAFMIGGSASRGIADRYSDLEIGVFWATTPSPDERQAFLTEYGAVMEQMVVDSSWEHLIGTDSVAISGFHVEVNHMLVDVIDAFLADPVKRIAHPFLGLAFLHARALYGERLVEHWRSLCREFPAEATAGAVRAAMTSPDSWRLWSLYATHGDLPALTLHLVYAQDRLLKAFAALNGDYYGLQERWYALGIAGWTVRPDRLAERLRGVFRLGPADAVHAMRALMYESFDLIEAHVGPLAEGRASFETPPAWAVKHARNAADHERIQSALSQLANAYDRLAGVECVARFNHGTGRRHDYHAPVELHVFWTREPSEAERLDPLRGEGAVIGEPISIEPVSVENGRHVARDACEIDGLQYAQVVHHTVESVEAALATVIDTTDYNHSTDAARQDMLAVLGQLRPMAGAPLLREWRSRCATMPGRVVERQVAWWLDYLRPQLIVEKYAARDEWLVFYVNLAWKSLELCETLRGLNGVYQPWRHGEDAPNWWVRWRHGSLAARLDIAPRDFAARLRALYR
ncbi:hypothetical protein CMK11_07740, partial [Candidatus Poribacteria bacterium]|nr:hypothetical protein [Candidatus Poribacteria bacterium]